MINQVSVKIDYETKNFIDENRQGLSIPRFIQEAVKYYVKGLAGGNTVAADELKTVNQRLEDSNRMLAVVLNMVTKISENQQKDIIADVLKRVEEGL